MKRVSLQLNYEQIPQSTIQNNSQNRASMCYSTNFKKRTDALNAQRIGLDQCLEKPQISAVSTKLNNRTFSSKPVKRKKQLSGNNGGQNMKSDLGRIEVRARSLLMKHKKLESKTTTRLNDVMQNYNTVKTQAFFEDKIIEQITDDQMLQTCPNFTDSKQSLQQNQCIPIHRISLTQCNQKLSTNLQPQKMRRVSTTKTQMSSHDDQNPKQQFPQNQQISNRIFTAPSQSSHTISQQPSSTTTTKYKKQSLKTNNINFSQHFTIANEDKNSVFPTCRKMTLSNINKYYQLCIQEIKSTQLKKKHSKQQSKQADSVNSKFFNEGYKKSTIDPVPYSNNSNNNSNINVSPNIKLNMTTGIFHPNFSQTSTSPSKKQKNYQIPPQMARRIASAGPIRLLQNTNSIIKSFNKPTTNSCLTATKIVKPQFVVEHNLLWEQIRKTLEQGEEVGYNMCSKKQIIQRESLLFGKKGNNFNNKINRIFSFDRKQVFYDGNGKKQADFLKLARSKSTKNQPTSRKIQDQKLAAWEISPHVGGNDNFGGNQYYNL